MNQENQEQPKQAATSNRVRVKTMKLTTPQEISAKEAKQVHGGARNPLATRLDALSDSAGDDDGYGIGGTPNQ